MTHYSDAYRKTVTMDETGGVVSCPLVEALEPPQVTRQKWTGDMVLAIRAPMPIACRVAEAADVMALRAPVLVKQEVCNVP